jgi:hypothetical protein
MESKTKSDTETKNQNSEENKNKILFVMQSYFIYSVKSLVTFLKNTSETFATENKLQQGKEEAHRKLRSTCDEIVNEFNSVTMSLNNTSVDQVKIIKKVFYVLKDNMKLLENKDAALFTIRNEEGKITSIIPGVNLNLVYELMDDTDKTIIWFYLNTLFISSVSLVYSNTPENKHKKSVLDMVTKLKKETVSMSKSVGIDSMAFNVFIGINSDDEINMDSLMTNDIAIPGTEANSGFLNTLGLGNLMNLNSLSDEIKKFTDNDVNDTVNTLGQLLGDDDDVKDVCSTMVKTVIDDLKTNGVENIFDIAQRIGSKIGGVISPEKMAKTAHKMSDLMENNKDKLKDLKDDNGNPIGENLLKQFQNTFNMAKMFNDKK